MINSNLKRKTIADKSIKDKDSKSFYRNMIIRGIILPLIAVSVFLFFNWVESNNLIDIYYSNGISKTLLNIVSKITNIFPFSVAEVIFIPMVLISTIWLIINVAINIYKRRYKEGLNTISKIMRNASLIIISFYILWGFNYKSLGARYIFDIEKTTLTDEELVSLANKLISDAKVQRQLLVNESEILGVNEVTKSLYLKKNLDKISEAGNVAYDKLGVQSLLYPRTKVKPVLLSKFMSYSGIAGIFIPFTSEANINSNQDPMLYPASVLHEMAHQKGIASEDDANFVSYLVSMASDDPGMKYSGIMMALIHTMNKLSDVDHENFSKAYMSYSQDMKTDVKNYNDYWKEYEGKVSETVNKVNDSYLKINTQGGVTDYQGIVLLLLDYEKQGK